MPAMAVNVLRAQGRDAPTAEVRVTNMELFFDLVYVFAITQLSQFLFAHLTPRGALDALVLFSAVWWAWNYTAWATNWIDPQQPPAALVMVVLMALGLIMAAALPDAFTSRGGPFAIAYVLLGLVRSGFVALAFASRDPMRANNLRLVAWLAIAGVAWIAGGYLSGDPRLIAWLIGAALDILAPLHGFRLPGLESLPVERWRLTGGHLAERYQLIVIIALGESVLRVGLSASRAHGSIATDTAFVAGFLVSAALWAAYFLRLAAQGAERVATATDGRAARLGRSGYAYAHAVMVAGVIVVAVAIRGTIATPEAPASIASTVVMLGGPALYLLGLALFQRSAHLGSPLAPLLAVAALALLFVPAVAGADQLVVAVCATLVLLALAAAAARGGPDPAGRGGPDPAGRGGPDPAAGG
jgi:low temperature requirement protein LtrA